MRITKTYVMKWRAVVKSSSPFHTERWFYDEKEDYVGWCLEYINCKWFIEKTNLWLPWLEQNMLLCSRDWFIKLNDIRQLFYEHLQTPTARDFLIAQHSYLDY